MVNAMTQTNQRNHVDRNEKYRYMGILLSQMFKSVYFTTKKKKSFRKSLNL